MPDSIGSNFNAKQVKFGMHKVYAEFTKRLDPDLPFYYYTSDQKQYYEGPLLEFNQPSTVKPKAKTVPRREQPTAFAPHHATMPVRGSLSICPKFHNLPLELPPLPGKPVHLSDNSYI